MSSFESQAKSPPASQSGIQWRSYWDDEDPTLSLANRGDDGKYRFFRAVGLNQMKKAQLVEHESEFYDERDEFDATQAPTNDMSNWQLEKLADELLRQDSKRETCRHCREYGNETGEFESQPLINSKTKEYETDKQGNVLYADVPEIMCENGHRWYMGEGKRRGIAGDNSILFKNHLDDRRRREIQTSIGTPDPSIARGMYNRVHPNGRKQNSNEQRKKNGASFYR